MMFVVCIACIFCYLFERIKCLKQQACKRFKKSFVPKRGKFIRTNELTFIQRLNMKSQNLSPDCATTNTSHNPDASFH